MVPTIDWEHPPSTRRQPKALLRRLLNDGVLIVACAIILHILVQALRGAETVNAQGLRTYFIDGIVNSGFLVWGVVAVVALAGGYALVDALRSVFLIVSQIKERELPMKMRLHRKKSQKPLEETCS